MKAITPTLTLHAPSYEILDEWLTAEFNVWNSKAFCMLISLLKTFVHFRAINSDIYEVDQYSSALFYRTFFQGLLVNFNAFFIWSTEF
jgi:hypothetical protein